MFNLRNYKPHPENKYITVFIYHQPECGEYFISLLEERGFWFEKSGPEDEDQRIYIAVKHRDLKQCEDLNNLVLGKFRAPFIPNKMFRWMVILLPIIIIIISIIGYVISKTS